MLTTSSAGASLFCGLWEVPSRFALTCSDQSYFDWITTAHTRFEPKSNAANSFATREVLKFWLTYPGHFVIMLDHKIMRSVDEFWPGYQTQLQAALFRYPSLPLRLLSRSRATLLLLTVIALSVANDYERRRTLLLAWPLFLNAPPLLGDVREPGALLRCGFDRVAGGGPAAALRASVLCVDRRAALAHCGCGGVRGLHRSGRVALSRLAAAE